MSGRCRQPRVTKNLEGIAVDEAYRIEDQTALTISHQLLREGGLLSTGNNLAGEARLAHERRLSRVITTILCDSGGRYLSKIFNRDWLKAHRPDPDLPLESLWDKKIIDH